LPDVGLLDVLIGVARLGDDHRPRRRRHADLFLGGGHARPQVRVGVDAHLRLTWEVREFEVPVHISPNDALTMRQPGIDDPLAGEVIYHATTQVDRVHPATDPGGQEQGEDGKHRGVAVPQKSAQLDEKANVRPRRRRIPSPYLPAQEREDALLPLDGVGVERLDVLAAWHEPELRPGVRARGLELDAVMSKDRRVVLALDEEPGALGMIANDLSRLDDR